MDLSLQNNNGRDCLAWAKRRNHEPTAQWIEHFLRRQHGIASPRRAPGEREPAGRPGRRASAVQRLKSSISHEFGQILEGIGADAGDFQIQFNNNAL